MEQPKPGIPMGRGCCRWRTPAGPSENFSLEIPLPTSGPQMAKPNTQICDRSLGPQHQSQTKELTERASLVILEGPAGLPRLQASSECPVSPGRGRLSILSPCLIGLCEGR